VSEEGNLPKTKIFLKKIGEIAIAQRVKIATEKDMEEEKKIS
jgi:hypothetical protein